MSTMNRRRVGRSSLAISMLGVGGAPFGGLFTRLDSSSVEATIAAGLQAGINYLDTAPFYGYGLSERRIGDALREKKDIVISTKVGRLLKPGLVGDPANAGWPQALPFHPQFDYSYDGVMRSWEHSLQRLGLDHVDILYVHDIGEATHGAKAEAHFHNLTTGGYRALDELRAGGAVKAIGLGVNEWQVCRRALDIGQWDAFLLAGRYTLLEQEPLRTLFPDCAKAGTSIVVGGPFNSGVLVGGDTFDYGKVPESIRSKVAKLKDVGAEFGVPLAAAALQFPTAHASVAAVIPGVRSVTELSEVVAWAQVRIPREYWIRLKQAGLLDQDCPNGSVDSGYY